MAKNLSAAYVALKATVIASLLLLFATQNSVRAAEITFLCASALEPAMGELIQVFQSTSGHKVNASFATIGNNTDRIRKGDVADLAIVSIQQREDLQSERKLIPTTLVVIAKLGIGVSMKKGAAKPDVTSSEALKRTLLKARSIGVPRPTSGSPVGAYAPQLFDRLGISADVKSKLVLTPPGISSARLVAKGDAEIGLTAISEILADPDLELIGPLPDDVQHYIIYTGVIPSNAKEPAAAKAFIDFLTSRQAAPILKSRGLEPG